MQRFDYANKIVEANYPLELEACALVPSPDYVGFDSADFGKADDHTVAPRKVGGLINHKAVCRDVRHMQLQVAMNLMLGDDRIIDRMPRRTTQIGDRKLGSN